ncbi:hypothetical protein D3C80_1487620 [compost metagenome]
MQQPVGRLALQFISGYPFNRSWTPEGPDIGKNLCRIRKQIIEQHRYPVQAVILGSHDVRGTPAVPVKGGVKNRLHEIPVRKMIRPLPLALEAPDNRVMPVSLLLKAELSQPRVPHHEVTRDKRHFDTGLPLLLLQFIADLQVLRIIVCSGAAFFFNPGQGLCKFFFIINFFLEPAHVLGHIDVFIPHAQVVLEELFVHNRAGNPHRHRAHREI